MWCDAAVVVALTIGCLHTRHLGLGTLARGRVSIRPQLGPLSRRPLAKALGLGLVPAGP